MSQVWPWSAGLPLAANLSTLYGYRTLFERVDAAAADGYRFVETWWPFSTAAASEGDIDKFCASLEARNVRLVAINLEAGDVRRGDRGILSHPYAGDTIATNLAAIVSILKRTDCRIVNAVFGNRVSGLPWAEQFDIGVRRLVEVADTLSGLEALVVVETLNSVDSPSFPFINIADTVALVEHANALSAHRNIGILLDTYHLAVEQTATLDVIARHAKLIRHVQFADFPGRGAPGTGRLNFDEIAAALSGVGYQGYVGLEYVVASPEPVGPHDHKQGD